MIVGVLLAEPEGGPIAHFVVSVFHELDQGLNPICALCAAEPVCDGLTDFRVGMVAQMYQDVRGPVSLQVR